jgi:hypothetical protein
MIYKNLSLETCESDLAAVTSALSYFVDSTIALRAENAILTEQLSLCCPDFQANLDLFTL